MCGEINKSNVGENVKLCGWVNKRRDHGGVIFINLRDRTGIVQIVCNTNVSKEVHSKAQSVRNEYVLVVNGKVVRRAENLINPEMKTGEIEVIAENIEILSKSAPLPFEYKDAENVDERMRMQYRYIDLRRPQMFQNLFLRHKVAKAIRDFFDNAGFLEIETPFLTKSTPEGARDYLVPSRIHPGHFYALPQSPQIFKQLLMVGGIERYFQIVKCFRDEDLRADRQPEFTQLDFEMSFVNQEDIMKFIEDLMCYVFEKVTGVTLTQPFKRMTYKQAIEMYGSDKPDLRFDMKIIKLNKIFENTEFKVFQNIIKTNGVIAGINAKKCAHYSRKNIDTLTEFVKKNGAAGLVTIAFKENEIKSSIKKFLSANEIDAIKTTMKAEKGDLILIVADRYDITYSSLGALRLKIAKTENLIPQTEFNFPIFNGKNKPYVNEDSYKFVWITDFPLFEYSQEHEDYTYSHHPFTSPNLEDIELLKAGELDKIRSCAYDLVLNGWELGSGSIRIYDSELQNLIFKILKLSEEEINEKFSFLLEAFKYGVPPHGGFAFGLDRLVATIKNIDSIRDVVAFPKTLNAVCPLTGAPAKVTEQQLEDVHIQIRNQ